MATFLTTPKMSPELAQRIEQRLSRGRPKTKLNQELQRPRASRTIGLVLFALAVVVGGAYALRTYEKRQLERRQAEVSAELGRRRSQLPQGYEGLVPKVERWAQAAARDDKQDEVAAELRTDGGLDKWLARPALYVRGPAAALGKPGALADVAAASDKDAFLFCLLRPPPTRSDTDVLEKVKGVHFGGTRVGDATRNVQRLHHAMVGLSTVSAAFDERLAAAPSQAIVQKLAKELEHAPLEVTREAALSELLIVVADDGSTARAVLVDLANERLLLRIQRQPHAVRTTPAQKLHAAEMSGCELGLDVRAAPGG